MDRRNWKKRILALILPAFLMLFGFASGAQQADTVKAAGGNNRLEVHFMDVGQGDATLIMTDGHAMLIDAGNNGKGTAVQNYLQKQGIKKLDYVIGTHPDADHIGGLDVIIYKFDCGKVLLPDYQKNTKTYDEVEDTLKAKSYRAAHPAAGDIYQLGDAVFTVTAPADKKFDNANDYSIAVRLEYGKNAFLFVGDAEEDSENEMLKSKQDISADVYKVSHHGSKTGTSEEFLEKVDPQYAVISCGEDNSYGHPHAEVLNLLRREGVQVFRTDEQGTIVAVSDGRKITWNMSPDDSWKAGEPKGTAGDQDSGGSGAVQKAEKKAAGPRSVDGYILNTSTKKIHRPSCSSVKKMAEKNKKETDKEIEELKKDGYSPCKKCL